MNIPPVIYSHHRKLILYYKWRVETGKAYHR
jgi:hypothetical protein